MRIKKLIPLVFVSLIIGDSFTTAQAQFAIHEYIRLRDEQRWDEALQVIRKEIAEPMIDDTEYTASLRILGLSALGNYADVHGYSPGMDAEAERYYQEGLSLSKGDKAGEAGTNAAYAGYFSSSARNGFALPYIDLELKLWEDLGDVYQTFKVSDSKASVFNDMGDLALRDFYRLKALEIGADYFQIGVQPDDPHEWLQYYRILNKRADNIAGSGKAEELRSLLDYRVRIADKYLAFLSQTYKQNAELYAVDGQTGLAEDNFRLAEERLAADKKRLKKDYDDEFWGKMDLDMTCAHASILYRARSYSEAAVNAAECIRGWRGLGGANGITLGLLGIIQENAGDDAQALDLYSEAIASVESIRASYDVAQRTAFFRQNESRRPYWGLIRMLGKRAVNTGEADDFFAFLQASERIRARQFGELVNAEQGGAVSVDLLKSYAESMDTDTAVVTYVLTDSAFVVGAFTRDQFLVKVDPYDRPAFRSRIHDIVALLSDSASPVPELQQMLLESSGLVMDSIREMIADKGRVMVITDGELNMVPFDLWSVDNDSYAPLLQSKIVRSAPALRLLANASDVTTGSAGLFALGDPIYPDPTAVIAGIQASEIEQATRGIKYRSYFAPLPETRTEVESIAQLFGDQETAVLLGDDALESTVKAAGLEGYRYVHFATHGILGGDVPGIGEPALVLGKEDSEDGFLKASEAEQLSLNAELAVLSACNTGSGEYVNGEGVMGISRSFLIAGSQSVLVSLWPVASKATEDLMVLFYGYIQDGMPSDTALRTAKQDIMDTRPHPFYWAPFILVSQQ